MEALAVAIAVDRVQGFVKSKQGYIDHETGRRVDDNKTVCLANLRYVRDPSTNDGVDILIVPVTDADRKEAETLYDYFDQTLIMEKLSDSFDSDFNRQLAEMFKNKIVGVGGDIAKVASLPNSRRIGAKRDALAEFYRTNREVGSLVGSLKERIKVTAFIKDVKWIPKDSIHLVIGITPEQQIVKFFLNSRFSDIAESLAGEEIEFVGTVKRQDRNDYSGCLETVFNRVVIK